MKHFLGNRARLQWADLPEAMRAEELAEFSRVPLETMCAEMDAGRLPVIQIGDEKRILKSMLIAIGTPSLRSVGPRTIVEAPNEVEMQIGPFAHISNFEYRWPDGSSEDYRDVHEANAKCLGRAIRVVIGSTERDVAGKQDLIQKASFEVENHGLRIYLPSARLVLATRRAGVRRLIKPHCLQPLFKFPQRCENPCANCNTCTQALCSPVPALH